MFPLPNMEEPAAKKKRSSALLPDWSQLPKELLEIITDNVNCFDIVHARSVCTSWRSSFPFPSCLLRSSYSLPTFDKLSLETNEEGTYVLGKIPYFLFRVRALTAESPSEYFFGGIGRDESEELPCPIQCSVKVKIQGSDPTLMKMNDCQIFPLGHQYKMFGWELKDYRGVAFLPLYKEGRGGEFVVLLNYYYGKLMVLTSVEMKWKRFEKLSETLCSNVVTFRGRFYVSFLSRRTVVGIDPHSLEVTDLMPLPQSGLNFLVPSGDDELFLVEVMVPSGDFDFNRFTCNVSRLDEKAGKWVKVSDLGDRVLVIARLGNVSFSAKELPDGCGVSGNSIVFTNWPQDVTLFYKYGPYKGSAEELPDGYGVNGNIKTVWRTSRENSGVILNTFPVVALRVER
ncbi:F-box/kelch-repeat protein At1g64840-like [Brassica napus]|uniref:(rape) hypothetical protein n=1 Tax=Brassica napus TaxID=3708 RepID=A0A817AMQ7_BRANA|nr:F-box/kelch-repeat protein At1g64840-like [Brassica napus]CAF2279814.1 unnamed protein product [Brassica napus]